MPVTTIDIQELPARLEEMLQVACGGTEVIVTADNAPAPG